MCASNEMHIVSGQKGRTLVYYCGGEHFLPNLDLKHFCPNKIAIYSNFLPHLIYQTQKRHK